MNGTGTDQMFLGLGGTAEGISGNGFGRIFGPTFSPGRRFRVS